MRRTLAAALLLTGLAFFAHAQAPQQQQVVAHTNLKVGDMAPDFTLPDDAGHQVHLADFRGKKTVILAFYVLAFTGGWTKELQGYQSGIDSGKIDLDDTAVFGISVDRQPSNAAFAEKIGVKFLLLSDWKMDVMKAYGIYNEQRQFANRTTFVVDKEGKIQHIEEGTSAVDPAKAIDMCLALHKKDAPK
jgi:peroxiredoxin